MPPAGLVITYDQKGDVFLMYKCNKTGAVFLKEEDYLGFINKREECNIIKVGSVLIALMYDNEVEVRCSAIIPFGPILHYFFEWFDGTAWISALQIKGNVSLKEVFAEQI